MLCSGSAVADLSRYKKKVASQMYAGEAVQYIFGGTLRWSLRVIWASCYEQSHDRNQTTFGKHL